MTIHDDLCDWCGGYVDPIGCDAAKAQPGGKLWDGLCTEGLRGIYGHLTTQQLRDRAVNFQSLYDADPINWERLPTDRSPEALRKHLARLDLRDAAATMRAAIKDRQDNE